MFRLLVTISLVLLLPLTASASTMLVKRESAGLLLVYAPDPLGSVGWRWQEKPWSTWNIGVLSMGSRQITTASGTDWEYVYNGRPPGGSNDWMGGNHQNEVLLSMTILLDGKPYSISEIPLTNGLAAKSVEIIQETHLVHPQVSQPVAQVTRHYKLLNARTIQLDHQVRWIQTMDLAVCYVAMLPINKRYGRFFQMGNVTGEFPNNTRTDLYRGLTRVIQADLWGEPKDLGMRVTLGSSAMVLDYRYAPEGAFVWDLSLDHVKLYFPIVRNSPLRVNPGDVFNVQATWEIIEY